MAPQKHKINIIINSTVFQFRQNLLSNIRNRSLSIVWHNDGTATTISSFVVYVVSIMKSMVMMLLWNITWNWNRLPKLIPNILTPIAMNAYRVPLAKTPKGWANVTMIFFRCSWVVYNCFFNWSEDWFFEEN